MKGSLATSAVHSARRRWRASAAAAVLVLVVLSLLAPLSFLGLHNRFPAGYATDHRLPPEASFRRLRDMGGDGTSSKGVGFRTENLVNRFGSRFSKDVDGNHMTKIDELLNKKPIISFREKPILSERSTNSYSVAVNVTSHPEMESNSTYYQPEAIITHPKVFPSESLHSLTTKQGIGDGNKIYAEGGNTNEIRNCQLELGSYCLWALEHKEVMKDSTVKRLKDQLFVARAYYPSVAKLHGRLELSRELKQNIQEHERLLSEAIVDADLPHFVDKKIQNMELSIARAQAISVGCNNVHKKLRQILDITEDESNFHRKQSAFLYNLGVQTMPKSLHCLSMRLTVESFKSSSRGPKKFRPKKLDSSNLMHYVIFSRNILAVAVTINSTTMNSEENRNMVFYIITDVENYYAMKLWFVRNAYEEATVLVINFEELNLKYLHIAGMDKLSLSEEFRVSVHKSDQPKTTTEYISVFGHSHFLIPEIFKNLKKVVVLDDDVVVQHDLLPLWKLDLEGKVNGAVEFCGVRLGQLKHLLGRNSYDASSCVWMSGLNIIDLEKWREHNITETYFQHLEMFHIKNEVSYRSAALPASIIAFRDLIYPLSERWSLAGLGHNYDINADAIKNAASLHYNGNMKPWLDLGIPNYKKYWKKFVTRDERFMDECKILNWEKQFSGEEIEEGNHTVQAVFDYGCRI